MTLHVKRYNVEGFGLGEPQEASTVGVVVVGLHDRRTCPHLCRLAICQRPTPPRACGGMLSSTRHPISVRTCHGQQGLDGLGFG